MIRIYVYNFKYLYKKTVVGIKVSKYPHSAQRNFVGTCNIMYILRKYNPLRLGVLKFIANIIMRLNTEQIDEGQSFVLTHLCLTACLDLRLRIH